MLDLLMNVLVLVLSSFGRKFNMVMLSSLWRTANWPIRMDDTVVFVR